MLKKKKKNAIKTGFIEFIDFDAILNQKYCRVKSRKFYPNFFV